MIQTSKRQIHVRDNGNNLQSKKTFHDKLSLTKQHKEENNMFAHFATKISTKVLPKMIANPALAVELAPVIAVAGVAVAIYDLVNK